ncbi:MAG: diphosphomevalonate decarboxylase, partial [Leeuwenhoekiella sp.]
MIIKEFITDQSLEMLDAGKVSVEAPSNIALVKYWGKYGEQLPKNTSLSLTLNNCKTTTHLSYTPITSKDTSDTFQFKVYLDGERKLDFEPKIDQFFNRITPYLDFLKSYKFIIETSNSFPHSSGIASSASGMSALSLCLLKMEQQMGANISQDHFIRKASFLSRLGSGSACRSISGPIVSWGEHNSLPGSSAYYGTQVGFDVASVFMDFQDTILLVDSGKKEVSST